jgi:hypothetical protein
MAIAHHMDMLPFLLIGENLENISTLPAKNWIHNVFFAKITKIPNIATFFKKNTRKKTSSRSEDWQGAEGRMRDWFVETRHVTSLQTVNYYFLYKNGFALPFVLYLSGIRLPFKDDNAVVGLP